MLDSWKHYTDYNNLDSWMKFADYMLDSWIRYVDYKLDRWIVKYNQFVEEKSKLICLTQTVLIVIL